MRRILLVEDDPILGASLKLNLEIETNQVSWARSLAEADAVNRSQAFHVILLDLGLPDGQGLDFCKRLRQEGSRIPVIILTAQADEDSVVEGFQVGANDYVKKPYSTKELLARVKAVVREPQMREDQIRIGDLLILKEQRRVFIDGEEMSLNRREFDVLKVLAENLGVVLTREAIIQKLGGAEDIFDRTIDSHVSHIRSKLKQSEKRSIKIKSEYGVGYRLIEND